MLTDSRGVDICREDLVAWYGRMGSKRKSVHLGQVDKMTWTGKIQVDVVRYGMDGELRTTGIVIFVRSRELMVIDDLPESPYE